MKPLPYAKALRDRRHAGERIGLLVVSVHDWEAGKDLESLPNVARLVVPPDGLPHEFDWSCAVALDCLVCGDGAESVFYAAALMLMAARSASVWGLFADGVWLLEQGSPRWYRHGLVATEGPVLPGKLAAALRNHRERALLTRAGVYGTPLFDGARVALFDHIFGPLSAKAQAWVAEKQRLSGRAA
jgi:hypothetical protein